ncbi:MAG: hypothetical protein ACYTG0_39765 [Planctomycetota bacterium]
MVYLETIDDWVREQDPDGDPDPALREPDNVVHEIGHAVSGLDLHPVTWWPSFPCRYKAEYLNGIRTAEKPVRP